MLKFLLCFFSLLICGLGYSQNEFGKVTQADLDLKIYEKDSTASAVVLYEKGDFKFSLHDGSIFLIKKYEVKIKILTDRGFEHANVEIPFYYNDNNTEKVFDIKGITHNGAVKTGLGKEAIFEVDKTENWKFKKFALPNIKTGSIIQYSYKIKTPFFFNLDGWDFQSDIPKVYSEFNAEIPGNYYYNRSLYGSLALDVEESDLKTHCFYFGGGRPEVDCEVLKYAMRDIPAFNKEENYMLAPSNYISRLDFELSIHFKLDGSKREFTKSWDDFDREFRKDKDIGRQLAKDSYFEKKLPELGLDSDDPMTKAKKIYDHVKNHFTWNGKYGIYKNIRVKDAYDNKVGNIGEINISLINLLEAAGLKTNLMLVSTRQNGLPKKNQPAITDFNYVVARVEIDNEVYLLDASKKLNPFGMLPFRCLNHYGRVMDFKKNSYWQDIHPEKKNKTLIRSTVKLDLEDGSIKGKFIEMNQGYDAVEKYTLLKSKTEAEYLDEFESSTGLDFYVEDYAFNKEKSNPKRSMQSYDFVIENAVDGDKIYLNPIIIKFFDANPFLSNRRNFPVDFGYPRSYEYGINIEIPQNYQVQSLPEKKAIALPNGSGLINFECARNNNYVSLRYLLELKDTHFLPEQYKVLQDFFRNAIEIQENTLVMLSKI